MAFLWPVVAVALALAPQAEERPAKFHHVHLNSYDPAAAMEYFARNFRGVKVILPGLGVGVKFEKSYVLFERVEEEPPAKIQSAAWHIGWGCQNIQECFQNAKDKGLTIHTPLTPLGPDFHYAYLTGPDGVLIEINTHTADLFGHVHLLSDDPVKAGEWYVKYLGAKPRAGAPPLYRGKPWATLMIDDVNLIIFSKEGRLEDGATALVPTEGRVIDHLAFAYPAIAPVLDRLEKAGVKVRSRSKTSAFLDGPDGLRVELVEDAEMGVPAFWCPMDPKVRSAEPGKCPVCGMTLVPLDPGAYFEFPVSLQLAPKAPLPGRPVQMRFEVTDPRKDVRVTEFETIHEKLFHLFVVSHDLEFFDHVHPEPQKDGAFLLEMTLPKAGPYQTYADFFPSGGTPQVVARSFVTAGFRGSLSDYRARLKPNGVNESLAEGTRVKLSATQFICGRKQDLAYTLLDAKTGQPVKDLEPYLGAWGHMLILSEDLQDYVHAHADLESDTQGGSQLNFQAVFPRPGNYKVWAQFQRRGKAITVPFVVQANRLR
jgi:catechol 2,3-dioxygenase-like lactoylglutathione lyase family enzyme